MSCAQINLKITNYDWSKLINKLEQTRKFCMQHPEKKIYHSGTHDYRYNFNKIGSFSPFNNSTKIPFNAGCMAGLIVETEIPWINKLKEDIGIVNSVSFQFNIESIARHVDGQDDPAITQHCKLNYMISDQDYVTYVDTGDKILSYPTKKDTAWLIDTSLPHWVHGQGTRYTFQLGFHVSFETAKQHLESLNLTY